MEKMACVESVIALTAELTSRLKPEAGMTKRHTDGLDGKGDWTGGTERVGRLSYPLQILWSRRQQRLTTGEPVASEDDVLAQSHFLQPITHLLPAPLHKRQLQVSDKGGKNRRDEGQTKSSPS